jgi:LysR family hydrogen peroxide-inducible transcriptional activator
MTIAQLKYLLAVAKHLNFTKASQQCHVTQPTLSMQIQKLEDELGVIIFDRNKKPIKITEIGKKIIDQAKTIVNESARINDLVQQEKGYIGGEYRLGIIPTLVPTILPMFLKTFLKKYDKVKLEIVEIPTQQMIEELLEGKLDAGIAATPLEEEKIEEKPLFYEPFVGFIPDTHRLYEKKVLNEQDLDVKDILLLDEGHCFRDNILNICRMESNESQPFDLNIGNFDTLIKLAKEGLGMTLLPYLQTEDLCEKDRKYLRNFNKPEPAREVSLIHSKDIFKKNITEALFKTIKGIVKGAIEFYDVKIISPLPSKPIE